MGLSKNRQLSNLLDKDSGLVKSTLSDSDQIVASGSKGIASTSAGTTVYATLANLPGSATTGDQAFVSSNNGLYIYNGSGWYKVAIVNATPYWSSEASSSYTFTIDTAITITLLAGDSDGHSITYTATPDSDANLFITITKDSDNGRVFTLTPDSENEAPGISNSGTITFKASDGISFASTVSTFTLNFSNIISNSAETVFLLKADSDSANNEAITYQNSSGVSTDFAKNSNPQASTFSPYRSGGYSTKFTDGVAGNLNWSGTYLDSDYTIEAWIYTTEVDNSGYNNILSDQSSNVQLTLHNTSTGNITTVYGGAVKLGPTSTGTGLAEWAHFVWEREGTTIRHYANGSLVGSGTADSNAFTISKIGQYYTGGWEHHGYIRDLRVLKTAKYGGSSYTVPTSTPALSDDATTQFIACHLPYIQAEGVSISRTGSTYTSTTPFGPYDYEPWTANNVGGSVYFDGTDDGITTTSTAIGTGEFTVEAWIYLHSTDTETIFDTRADGNNTGIEFRVNSGVLRLIVGATGTVCTGYTDLLANTWYHVAATRNSSNVCKVYLNGKTDGSSSTATDNLTNTSVTIGRQHASTQFFDGYIADLRFRTESYTANYTPPTSPLSNTASTQLLMNNKSDANVYDAAAASSLTLYGAVSSTTQRKFTTSSAIYFDGTDDYVRSPHKVIGSTNTDPILETFTSTASPFTIEGWVYWHKTPASLTFFIGINPMGTPSANTVLIGQNANAWKLFINSTEQTPTGTITDNTWYHFALTFDATNVKFYVDGTQTYSAAETSIGPLSTQVFLLGTEADGANGGSLGNWGGVYVQDIRISHGVRYTTAFTPPTTEFEL